MAAKAFRIDGLAFFLGFGHNLMKTSEGIVTVWTRKWDLLPLVVNTPDLAGLPKPGLCVTSHDETPVGDRNSRFSFEITSS